jgi:hypothetical protein
VFVIELTKGPSWDRPSILVDRRELVGATYAEIAEAEAHAWLLSVQRHHPEQGATHYRLRTPSGTVIGGPN